MKYIESATIELKRELTDNVKNAIVAFLNTSGGTIYVGVNDDGTPNPAFLAANKDEEDKKVANWIQEAIYPSPSDFIKHSFNKRGVMVIQIEEGSRKPYFIKNKGPKPSGVYRRVGSTTRKATEDEILRMIMLSNDYVYEDDVSEEQQLTFKELKTTFDQRDIEWQERFFMSLGMKNKKGIYTNLAYLLSDQSPLTVKFAEYDTDRNFIQKKNITGSLLKILFEAEDLSDRQNVVSAIIDGSTFERKETKSYPGAALREVVMNAFCHADYFIRSNIKIEFFPEHARITSPGGIYNATMDDIMHGVQTYRNPKLVHVLDKLGLIENFGTGIPRTFDAYKNTGQEPVFDSTDNFFFVSLPNLNYVLDDEINDKISDEINDKISDLGLEILKLIKARPGVKVPTIYTELHKKDKDINVDKIRNEIRRNLQNYIEYIGSKKTGGYYIKNGNH